MTSCGTITYTDPDDFRERLSSAVVNLVLTGNEPYRARLTWLKQRRLTLVSAEQTTSHITFLSLDPARIYVSFPLRGDSVMNGIRVRRGDFMIHARGERVHHLAKGGTHWGLISMRARELAGYGRVLLGQEPSLPVAAHLVRPSGKTSARILRLHAQACRLAARQPDIMAHREVARSVEHDLIVVLLALLASDKGRVRDATNQRRADIMARFEDALAARTDQQSLSSICEALGVPPRTLRICCSAFLGCGPLEYMRLRRLNQVRSALCRADHDTVTVAGIAKTHGFSEPGRFAGAYRAVFGETPSATLLRSSAESA